MQGAAGFETQTPDTKEVDKPTWDAMWNDLSNPAGPIICTRTGYFASLKGAQEQLCSQTGNCIFNSQPNLLTFLNNIEKFQQTAEVPK